MNTYKLITDSLTITAIIAILNLLLGFIKSRKFYLVLDLLIQIYLIILYAGLLYFSVYYLKDSLDTSGPIKDSSSGIISLMTFSVLSVVQFISIINNIVLDRKSFNIFMKLRLYLLLLAFCSITIIFISPVNSIFFLVILLIVSLIFYPCLTGVDLYYTYFKKCDKNLIKQEYV